MYTPTLAIKVMVTQYITEWSPWCSAWVVSKPDPQKIKKEGLVNRLGRKTTILLASYPGHSYVARYAQLTVSTNLYHTATLEQVLACKETVLCASTVVVSRKSAEGKLSF